MSYPQQPQQSYPQQFYPVPAPAPPRKRRTWPWAVAAVVAAFVIIGVANQGGTGAPSDEPGGVAAGTEADRTADQPADKTADKPAEKAKPAAPVAQSGPATTLSGGVYQVGVDVQPGRYKTPGPAADDPMGMCYWARMKDDSGNFEALITNGIVEGPGSVTINAGEFVELTGGCTWVKAG